MRGCGTHGSASRVRLQPGDGRHQHLPASAGLARCRGAGAQARAEFERVAQALSSEGISVCAVDDTTPPAKPDAVFPNNWLSFHDDGTVVLYPMQSASRRLERRQEVIDAAVKRRLEERR